MANSTIQCGQFVSFTYSIKDDQGEIVEHSDLPINFIHGGVHEVFPQIEAALLGKQVNDLVEVFIAYPDAFGPYDSTLTFTDDLANAPQEHHFIGSEFDMQNAKGETLHFRVAEISDGKITIDANHPLAGKDITFLIKVREVREPKPEELSRQPDST